MNKELTWEFRNILILAEYKRICNEFNDSVCKKCYADQKNKLKCVEYGDTGIKQCILLNRVLKQKLGNAVQVQLSTVAEF